MSTDEEPKTSKTPKISTKDGSVSKLMDGVTDTLNAVAKTVIETARSPITVASRTIDGAVQGTKQGVEQSDKPIGKVGKGAMGTVGGSVQGTVKGVEKAMQRVGGAIEEFAQGVSKVGKALSGGADEIGEVTGIKRED